MSWRAARDWLLSTCHMAPESEPSSRGAKTPRLRATRPHTRNTRRRWMRIQLPTAANGSVFIGFLLGSIASYLCGHYTNNPLGYGKRRPMVLLVHAPPREDSAGDGQIAPPNARRLRNPLVAGREPGAPWD